MIKIDLIHALTDNYIFALKIPNTKNVIIIDPAEAEPVEEFLNKNQLTLKCIWLTHHHLDHIAGVESLRTNYDFRLYGHIQDIHRLPALDVCLQEKDIFSCHGLTVQVKHLPGHTSGHIAFYLTDHDILFIGDTLFNMGCGRLFEGTHIEMLESLRWLHQLPDQTLLYAAHEYTLQNIDFALKIINVDHPLSHTMLHFDKTCRTDRKNNKPTIPFALGLQKKLNPFLACMSDEGRQLYGCAHLNSLESFKKLRQRKDHTSG